MSTGTNDAALVQIIAQINVLQVPTNVAGKGIATFCSPMFAAFRPKGRYLIW